MGLIFNLTKVLKPAVFHGHNRKKNFFEGWYFKIVDKAGENIFALIPAIFLSNSCGDSGVKSRSHFFIQVLDGIRMKPYYHRYDVGGFKAADESF